MIVQGIIFTAPGFWILEYQLVTYVNVLQYTSKYLQGLLCKYFKYLKYVRIELKYKYKYITFVQKVFKYKYKHSRRCT